MAPPKKIVVTEVTTENTTEVNNAPFRVARWKNILPGTVFADHWEEVTEIPTGHVVPSRPSDSEGIPLPWLLITDQGTSRWVGDGGKDAHPHHLAMASFVGGFTGGGGARTRTPAVVVDVGDDGEDLGVLFDGLDSATVQEPRQEQIKAIIAYVRSHLRSLTDGLRAGSDEASKLALSDELEHGSNVAELDSAVVSLNNWLTVAKAPVRVKRAHNKGGNRAIRLYMP